MGYFETKQDLIEYISFREELPHDEAEDYVNQFIQSVYDCEGDMEAVKDIIYQFLFCEPQHVCLSVLEE